MFKELQWDEAYLRQLADNNLAVIIPILFEEEYYPQKNNSSYSLNQLSNIMMYQNEEGSFNLEVVTTLPDSAFFTDSTFDKPFTGLVLVENWNGELLKSIHYTPEGIFIDDKEKNSGPSLKRSTPNELCPIYTDWYTCSSMDGGETWSCHYTETTTTYTICPGSGGATTPPNQTVIINYPPYIGGSGNTAPPQNNPINENSPISEKIELIFNLDSLPDSIQAILINDLNRVNENCVGKFILDALTGANGLLENSMNINIVYDPNTNYNSYDPTSNTINLTQVINFFGEQPLIHELAHAVQDGLYNQDIIEKATNSLLYEGRCQLELEAHVIEDLSRDSKNYKDFSNGIRSIQDNYELFMTDLKNNNPNINSFNSFLGPFMQHNPQYESIPNTNFTPILFQLAYQNCND
nr:hypothetical protein [uncultured Carboxylicivirga sp.]